MTSKPSTSLTFGISNSDTSSFEFCTMSGIVPIPITGLEVPAPTLTPMILLESHLIFLSQLLFQVIEQVDDKSM
jgi:hypothetical protein